MFTTATAPSTLRHCNILIIHMGVHYGTILFICLKPDSNQGPNCLSLLDFETWRIRPLGHDSWSQSNLFRVHFSLFIWYHKCNEANTMVRGSVFKRGPLKSGNDIFFENYFHCILDYDKLRGTKY